MSCKYCKGTIKNSSIKQREDTSSHYIGTRVDIDRQNSRMKILFNSGVSIQTPSGSDTFTSIKVYIPIKFCPMCGEALRYDES